MQNHYLRSDPSEDMDPGPNKTEEIKLDPVLNEQGEKLSKEEKANEQQANETWGEDKDGLAKAPDNATNVDTEILNGGDTITNDNVE